MPKRLRAFVVADWCDLGQASSKYPRAVMAHQAMHAYYRARVEWLKAQDGSLSNAEAWELARKDGNSGLIGWWEVVGSRCRVAELKAEAGLGEFEDFCERRPCPCGRAGKIVAVDRQRPA